MSCLALVMGMLGGATWHVQSSMQLRTSAVEFVQAAKAARRYAIDHRCRTRIVFRSGLILGDASKPVAPEERSYRVLAFVVPTSRSADAAQWIQTGQNGREASEFVRTELSPRSQSLVGRWMMCDAEPVSHSVSDAIRIASPLFDQFVKDGADEYFAENFYCPETVWNEDCLDPHEPANCYSIYPEDYHLSPVDRLPLLVRAELPESETCKDPLSGRVVPAAQFWPGEVEFIGGADPEGARALPGIEFQPDGSLSSRSAEEVAVSFSYLQRPQTAYTVLIDPVTGLARIDEEPVP